MRTTKQRGTICLGISLLGALALGCSGTNSGTIRGTAGAGGSGGGGATSGTAGAGGSGGGGVTELIDPGKTVNVTAAPTASAEEARLRGALDELKGLSAQDFAARFAPVAEAAPKYERSAIAGLDTIQASSLALDEAALSKLDANGFAISNAHPFPTFAYGYATLYLEDLPLYVSADSILTAIHQSYDSMLATLEELRLSPELDILLSGMQQRLAQGVGAELGSAVQDADVFLAVARSLLKDQIVAPVAGGSVDEVRKLVGLAKAGQGVTTFTLFGVKRVDEDFSQFTPRGHYTDSPGLTRYFKAMMWLGRIDLRLLETQPDGAQVFRRQQFEVMMLLRELIDANLRVSFDRVDRTVAAFVGEPDYMVLSQVDSLASDLAVSELSQLAGLSDQAIAQAVIDGGYGQQRISSHIMMNGTADDSTLPLSRSFALLGQRYVIDSHVFSNVVYDRIGKRMMPDPLDVAFAALGNDRAGALLERQLSHYESTGYPGALAEMRLLVDDHPADFWDATLYTHWLGALRTLSPGADAAANDATGPGLFPVARSEAWQRRMLNTQLASWAELRHDTILYAKQSYSGGATCEFPDAYVDPYPAFFGAIAAYGARGQAMFDQLDLGPLQPEVAGLISSHFTQVVDVATRLKGMAEHELTGAEFTPEMMAFINEAVVLQTGCGSADLQAGWYKKLFFQPWKATVADPTIADVHTQPTDEAGNMVGRVLHVGTGMPRTMVVVAEGCSGPRAYAGLVSSYREKITEDFERLDDPTWAAQAHNEPEVPWMSELVTP